MRYIVGYNMPSAHDYQSPAIKTQHVFTCVVSPSLALLRFEHHTQFVEAGDLRDPSPFLHNSMEECITFVETVNSARLHKKQKMTS